MSSRVLHVLIAGRHVGTLSQAGNGLLSFVYDAGYEGVPLSLSMPVSNRAYGDKVIRPYLCGLLPDSPEVRRRLGREHGVSGNNPFALLEFIGLDCPGAVQFCSERSLDAMASRQDALQPITDAEIAARLSLGRVDTAAQWESEDEHWSLGGQQSKLALRLENGVWYSCLGAAATTHIIKPGISGLRLEALNEFVCLRLALACGIPAARADYVLFEDEPAIVIARYDSVRDAGGKVARLHQEDLCQALGILPENKYPEEGGPGANDIVAVLRRTGHPASENISDFVTLLLFNYLIGAPDAHAKNYSLLLDRDDAYLAPIYDVASMLPYADRPLQIKLAMSVAGENRVARLSESRLTRFAEANGLADCGLDGTALATQLASLASEVPGRLETVFEENSDMPGMGELADRMLGPVRTLCELSVAQL